jgi:hypothetical protein
MGFFDSLSSLIPFSTPVDAEAASDNAEPRASVSGGASNKTPAASAGESADEADVNKQDAGEADGDDSDAHVQGGKSGDDEAEPEEEEEDDEPVDPAVALEEGMFSCSGFWGR